MLWLAHFPGRTENGGSPVFESFACGGLRLRIISVFLCFTCWGRVGLVNLLYIIWIGYGYYSIIYYTI